METMLKKTMTQEAWKYLYGILSRVFFTNEEDLVVADTIFNTIEPAALAYDTEDVLMENEMHRLKQQYKTQLTRDATEEQIKVTMDKMKQLENAKIAWAVKEVEVQIPKSDCQFIANVIRNFMKTKFVDEAMRSEWVVGRWDIRLRTQVLETFNINQ